MNDVGILALEFNGGIGVIQGGELFDISSRFLTFIKTSIFLSSVEAVRSKDGSVLLVIKDDKPTKLTYYNLGIPKLSADLTNQQEGTKSYEVQIGNTGNMINFEVEIEVDPSDNKRKEIILE